MQKTIFVFAFLALSFAFAQAQETIVNFFRAVSEGDAIVVQWESSDESGVNYYDVQRAPEGGMFQTIKRVDARGYASAYKIIDEEAFMRDADEEVFQQMNYKYRIKIVSKDGSFEYGETANVSHKVSSVRRTWGMIKEMFK